MTYQPRTQEAQQYSQSIGNAAKTAIKPAMPIIDTWKKGVDIAGQYSPVVGAGLRTVPAAIGIAMGAKPALQAGRQVSEGLGAMQGRMIANANAPRTLNAGFMGQRGAINPSDFNLVTNPDGTVTMYHGTTKDAAKKIIQERKLLSAGEPDVYMTTDPMAGYGDGTTVKFNIDPKHINLDDEFPSGRVDFRMPAAKGWRIQNPEINTPKRPLTEFEQAHLTAQRNAALPVNQGGLGLAPDNTAMDRARAMGFDVDNPVYHGTNWDFLEFNRVGEKANALGLGHYTTPNPKKADMYGDRVMPLLTKNDGVLDWGNLSDAQRKEISANLKDRVPHEDMAGYAPLSKKQFPKTDNGTSEAKAFFREKQKETSNYFHDRAKPNIVDDGENWAIEWRDPTNMDGANNQDLLNLSQRFDPDMANALGYKGAKFGDETAIYDPKNIRSRFAAFDPFNRESSNLLAQSAKLAPTTALGAYMYNEKRKKSQGNQ